MSIVLWLTACGQRYSASTPDNLPEVFIASAAIPKAITPTLPMSSDVFGARAPTAIAIPTLDQNSDTKCQQTIRDIYNKVYCPDREDILDDLFTEPFVLNKQPWLSMCENGPLAEVVAIEGPTTHTVRNFSYTVTVKFWYPEGKGSGPGAFTSLIFINAAIGDDGDCRVSGASGGG
jgi:hypothetical protein